MSSDGDNSSFNPPLREIIVFQPETFPLHRWDNSAPGRRDYPSGKRRNENDNVDGHQKTKELKEWKQKSLLQLQGDEDTKDELPALPFREVSCEMRTAMDNYATNCDIRPPGMPSRQLSDESASDSSDEDEDDGGAYNNNGYHEDPNSGDAKPPGLPQRQLSCCSDDDDDDDDDACYEEEVQEQGTTAAAACSKPPRRPRRSRSRDDDNPPFLNPTPMGPSSAYRRGGRRKPPKRTWGRYTNNNKSSANAHRMDDNKPIDMNEILLKPISFNDEKKRGKKQQLLLEDSIARPLQEVVLQQHRHQPQQQQSSSSSSSQVTVMFLIRRPGCGMCREHGMQLAKLCQENSSNGNNNIQLMGVLKETIGIHKSIYEFYGKYFSFPLYLDEGWDLFHTIGHKKINLFQYLSKSAALNIYYLNQGIKNIPFGGDPLTQGGVLIFDSKCTLRYVYYESYGKSLDITAIQWAIDQARKK